MAREIFVVMVESPLTEEPEVAFTCDSFQEAEDCLHDILVSEQQHMLDHNLPACLKESWGRSYHIQKFIAKGRPARTSKVPELVSLEGSMSTCRYCFRKTVDKEIGYNLALAFEDGRNVVACPDCWRERKYENK